VANPLATHDTIETFDPRGAVGGVPSVLARVARKRVQYFETRTGATMRLSAVRMIASGCLALAYFGDDTGQRSINSRPATSTDTAVARPVVELEVVSDEANIYMQSDETSYSPVTLKRGDRAKLRTRETGDWLTIEPPLAMICWIERSAFEPGVSSSDRQTARVVVESAVAERLARVIIAGAVVRTGHRRARIPGPPAVRLAQGTIVRLVDLAPIKIGQGKNTRTWCAIEPPPGLTCYILAARTRPLADARSRLAGTQAAYARATETGENEKPPAQDSPPAIASEVASTEVTHRAILKGQPIAKWDVQPVRAHYQPLPRSSGEGPASEEAIRTRLGKVGQREQVVDAARLIERILAESHRRDGEVAVVQKRIASMRRSHARAYQAVGVIQPSARNVDGRKLYVLIASTGKTVAYLDIPPGLDPVPLISRRVGVRGAPHYSEDLGTRLITVRAVEPLEVRR
jgi:hypothetical protein